MNWIKKYSDNDQFQRDINTNALTNIDYIQWINLWFLYEKHSENFNDYIFILSWGQIFRESIINKNFKWLIYRGVHSYDSANPFNIDINYTLENTENRFIELIELSNNSKINNFSIQNSSKNKVCINKLLLEDFDVENNNCVISNIDFEELHFSNFTNNWKTIILTNWVIKYLRISNSDLWKTIFNWVVIEKLILENATINECIFNWVIFPNNLEDIWNNEKQKDNYRQMKHVMDKNWNHTEANKFYALEMNEELKIALNKFSWKELNEKFRKKEYFSWTFSNFSNLVALWFNKLFSNFWTNWILSLFWLVTIAFFGSVWIFYYSQNNIRGFSNTINAVWNWYLESWIIFPIVFLFSVSFFIYLLIKFTNKAPIISSIIYFFILYYFYDPKLLLDFTQLLINPLYLLDFNWIESPFAVIMIWLYKILYWTIIYQLITTIRRTTKR